MSQPDPARADTGASPIASGAVLRRLLVGYDGSEASGVASSFGLWLAGKGHARLTLLHVFDDAPRAEGLASPELLAAAAERRREEDRRWREELANLRAYAAKDASVETHVARGNAAKTLLEEARARAIDLILLGSTGVGTCAARCSAVALGLSDLRDCNEATAARGARSPKPRRTSSTLGCR